MSEIFQLIRLGDLCNSISGLWTGKKPPFDKATVVRNTNFTKNCKLDLSNVAVLDVETKQLQTRKLLPGDLIVEKSGGGPNQAVGRVVYFNENLGTYSLSNFTSALRIKDVTKALPKYLQHFLYYQYVSGVTETMQSNSTGIRNLNIHRFLDIKVPLPQLDRQYEIVEKLDRAFEEIDLLEKNLVLGDEKASQLLQSLLDSSFSQSTANGRLGPKVFKLKDVCLEVPRVNPKVLGRETFKYLDIGSLSSNSRAVGNVDLVSVMDAPGRARQLLSKGDSVFSTVRPYMKKIAYIDESLHNEIASTGFCVLRPNLAMVDPRFIYHYLSSDVLLDQVLPLQTGVSYPAIRDNDLKGASIALPTLEKQREIAEKLDLAFGEIEKIRNRLAIKRDFVSMFKQSLLSDAFSPTSEMMSA